MVSSAGLVELRPPVQPMVARAAAELPDDEHGVSSYEAKLDGFLN